MTFYRVVPALLLVAATSVAAQTTTTDAINTCGSLSNAYGPYDYRTDKDSLPIVENVHFPPIVENLIAGNRGYLGGDLDYTLRAFPNHHRALVSVMNYGLKLKTEQPKDLPRPVECYFERAIRFRPRDPLTRLIYATYLKRHERTEEALDQLRTASEVPDLQPITRQNIGLFYADLKRYDLARALAWKNIEQGFRPERLIAMLAELGQWREPPSQADGRPAGPEK